MLLAEPSYLEAIAQLHHQTLSDEVEAPEVSHRYISEALKDPDSLLYILLKEGQVIGVCNGQCIWKMQLPFMDLRLLKSIVGKVTEAIWQKSLVNQLIAQNDKVFQIAVEDDNVGAKRLWMKRLALSHRLRWFI